MPEIYFLYIAMGCIALFGFLHIFFDDRFMNFKTVMKWPLSRQNYTHVS